MLPALVTTTESASKQAGKNVVIKRHVEWEDNQRRWRFLLDSWEGGEVYRQATYGNDQTFGLPIRNLIRHKREYPDPRDGAFSYGSVNYPIRGADPYTNANVDDYSLRLARTPVPAFVGEVVECHLSQIYSKEIERETTDKRLEQWWDDIDGCETTIDEWISTVVAPLLMVFGCLDILCDHPPAPDGVEIVSKADEKINRLDTCVASIILPENMVWWELDTRGRYTQCLVCEMIDGEVDIINALPTKVWRYWNADGWILYSYEGEEKARGDHPFGRVPIRRLFDRKRPRCRNVGLPRYEDVAELQREFYNRDSELILSDTLQAHPLLQGPDDYVTGDGTIPIGPAWMLPKKKNTMGGTATYEGFEVVDFPKDGAESLRQNLQMLRDRVDRSAKLTKPAGAQGTTGQTVAQSGISKTLDKTSGNDLLSKISITLQKAEREITELVLLVLYEKEPTPQQLDATQIGYPRSFNLSTADEMAADMVQFQLILQDAGNCPNSQAKLISRLYKLMMSGLSDEDYVEADEEFDEFLKVKADIKDQQQEMALNPPTPDPQVVPVDDDSDSGPSDLNATDEEASDP